MRTIFKNALGVNGLPSPQDATFTILMINDDIIEYVGDEEPEHKGDARVVDLQGQRVFPSFIDGHVHLLIFGASLFKVGLDDCHDLEDIRNMIAQTAKQNPSADRLLFRGWRQATTNRRATARMIDDIDFRPVYIDSDDLHSVWCNTAALRELDIQDAPDPAGGTIHRDGYGMPDGLMSESAALTIVWPFILGAATKAEKQEYLRLAIHSYNSNGYTGIIDMAMDEETWEMIEELYLTEPFTLRLAAHWLILPHGNVDQCLAEVDKAIEMRDKYNLGNSPNFRITGIKIICDGVVDSCTAALRRPYFDGTTAEPLWDASNLTQVLAKADKAGLQCALHAIGDEAVKMAVNGLESLGSRGHRHRIEHLELTSTEDAQRLGKLGITASIQPVHSDPSILHAWPNLIGQDRCSRAFAYKEFADYGAQLAIGTDAPTARHLPLANLYSAVTRRSARKPEMPETLNEHFALGLNQALSAMCWGTAYSCFGEGMTGSLEAGKKADFIVVEGLGDFNEAKLLLTAQVVQTWLDGKPVHQSR